MTTEPNQGRFRDQVLRTAAARAAESQAEFTAYMDQNPLNAVFFVKLISICDGGLGEALVLWDAIEHAVERGLVVVRTMAGSDYQGKYGSASVSERGYRRGLNSLIAEGILDEVPRGHTVAKRFFLNWPVLAGALANDVDMKLPGLRPSDVR